MEEQHFGIVCRAELSPVVGTPNALDLMRCHTVYPELIHAANDVGYTVHASGGAGAGAMIIAASVVALRTGSRHFGEEPADRLPRGLSPVPD